jgi:hypothetical protein
VLPGERWPEIDWTQASAENTRKTAMTASIT